MAECLVGSVDVQRRAGADVCGAGEVETVDVKDEEEGRWIGRERNALRPVNTPIIQHTRCLLRFHTGMAGASLCPVDAELQQEPTERDALGGRRSPGERGRLIYVLPGWRREGSRRV